MDSNIPFPFHCLIVLLGLLLTSMTTAQNNNGTAISTTNLPNYTDNQGNTSLTTSPVIPADSNDEALTNTSGSPNITRAEDDDNTTSISTTTSQPLAEKSSTPRPPGGNRSTTPAGSTKDKGTTRAMTRKPHVLTSAPDAQKNTGKTWIWIIIILIIILVVVTVCIKIRKKMKRKSMDLPNRQEDVPLSSHVLDVGFDNSAPKEMHTFTAVDLDSTEALVDDSPGTKADGGNSSDLPPPPSSVDGATPPKPDDVAPADAAPEPGALGVPGGETDDELAVSNKTSVESVSINEENNDNNNNNNIIIIRMPATTEGSLVTSRFSEA